MKSSAALYTVGDGGEKGRASVSDRLRQFEKTGLTANSRTEEHNHGGTHLD